MYEMAYVATEGFSFGMIIAWVLLLSMNVALVFLFVVFIADGILGWVEDMQEKRQRRNSPYSL